MESENNKPILHKVVARQNEQNPVAKTRRLGSMDEANSSQCQTMTNEKIHDASDYDDYD